MFKLLEPLLQQGRCDVWLVAVIGVVCCWMDDVMDVSMYLHLLSAGWMHQFMRISMCC
jgi:hypothetical protein